MCRSEWCTHRRVESTSGELTYVGRQVQLDRAWQGWVTNATITYSTVTTTTDAAWVQWNAAGTSTATLYINTAPLVVSNSGWQVAQLPERTPEQVEGDRLAREQRRERRQREAAELEAAKERAEELLVSYLDEVQRGELRVHNRFHVTTTSGRRYCINRGRAGNVRRPEDRRVFCIHDYEGLPEADTMLAQKLLLEADEEAFLRIANVTAY